MLLLFVVLSVVAFVIIELPPGSYLDIILASMEANGLMNEEFAQETIDRIVDTYGFDEPVWQRYFLWAGNFIRGDMGRSFMYNQPVNKLIGERIVHSFFISR